MASWGTGKSASTEDAAANWRRRRWAQVRWVDWLPAGVPIARAPTPLRPVVEPLGMWVICAPVHRCPPLWVQLVCAWRCHPNSRRGRIQSTIHCHTRAPPVSTYSQHHEPVLVAASLPAPGHSMADAGADDSVTASAGQPDTVPVVKRRFKTLQLPSK